jgi:hypothetical protein
MATLRCVNEMWVQSNRNKVQIEFLRPLLKTEKTASREYNGI